ncbi:metallophosphoesterase [Clostridioides difficile]
MQWLEGLQQSIDYIEENILEKLDYEYLARYTNVSVFYYQRMFSVLVGISVGEYIRNRRLTLDGGNTLDYKIVDKGEFSVIALKKQFSKDEDVFRKQIPRFWQDLFKTSLYVDDAKKWADVMKKDKADVIVAVVHSGEKPKKPKNPGNRIQDLAQNVDGIDAIVAGHTHVQIKQHDYKNNLGEQVIVTQPGKHGECVSKINFKLEKNNDKWNVVDKSSQLATLEKNQEMDKVSEFYGSLLSLDSKTKEISLGKVLPFKWDKLYVFEPYTPVETIYKTVGYKWRNIIPTDSEDMVQMVFMSNKKPICYIW